MAKRTKGGRTTPAPATKPRPGSKRYTPPQPKTVKHSLLWVPVSMFTSMGAGVVVIVCNYLQLLPGGEAKNSYLILGLVLLIAGFVLSTKFK